MKYKVKRLASMLLAMAFFVSCMPTIGHASGDLSESGYEDYIAFHYSFENVEGTSVINEVYGGSNAMLGSSALIIDDPERNGKVLSLPGGGANAGSWLTLPADLFSNVNGGDGFAISMWLKVPTIEDGASFTRLFCASPYELGSTNSGHKEWLWNDPEFAIVRGEAPSGAYNMRIFSGITGDGAAVDGTDIIFGSEFKPNTWQRLIVSMKNDDFAVYLNGVKIADLNSSIIDRSYWEFEDTIADTLQRFFDKDYLESLVNVSLGRGLYTSDGNFKGKIDDFIFYNKFLTEEDVAKVGQEENLAQLESLLAEAKLIAQEDYPKEDYLSLQVVITEIETLLAGGSISGTAIIEATERLQNAISALNKSAKITVDMADRSLGKIFHGASAALYGLSEPNVPDINTLIPIKPSHVLQKAPNGVQHPSGDGLRVADYFFEAGGGNIQVYMQDYYERWYYPVRTAQEYIDEAVIAIAEDIKNFKAEWAVKNPSQNADEKFIYVPFNEPEAWGTRYPSFNSNNATGVASRELFNQDWLAVYRAIKEIDPGAMVSGPNLITYKNLVIEDFLRFCVENDCLPDTISWHLLWNKAFLDAKSNVDVYRAAEDAIAPLYAEKYPDRESPFPLPIDINEYASTAEIAVGGSLLQYLARYDELKITGALPYWNTANSYGSLLAGQNEPNGAWWLYKWYADMEGDMAKVGIVKARDNDDSYGPGLYGLATIDDIKKQASIIFGGTTGQSQIVFENITGHECSPSFFANADKVHITVWYAGYTGLTGFAVEPTQIIDENFDVINGKVTLPVETDYSAAYYAVITEAVNSTPNTTWFKRYEAENAEVRTHVQSPAKLYPVSPGNGRSASNGQLIGGIDFEDSVVKFTNITVPADGNYRLDIVEGSGSTTSLPAQSGGGNTNQRQNSEFFIKIDDQPSFKVVLRADYGWEQLGMVTQYIDLTAGTHSIAISKYNQDTGEEGQGAATLDCIELTYNDEMGAQPNYRVQAEFAEYDTGKGLKRDTSVKGFQGAGYVTGYNSASNANTRFVISVLDDGMYDVTFRIATTSAGTLSVDHDRKNAFSFDIPDTKGEWKSYNVKMFLRTGINLIDVKSTANMNLDYINATFSSNDTVFSVEAEDCAIFGEPAEGDPAMIREDVFAKYASGGKYVNGITSYDGEERYLEITIPDVQKAGRYKLVVQYANGEYSGGHSYNNNVVERYAQISVNDGESETHHFKNTISWQQFATQTFDVQLNEGVNTIRFSNDNSYDGGSNPYGGNNADGTAGFTPRTCIEKPYTPAFDKFDIYPIYIADFDDNGGGDNGGNNGGSDSGGSGGGGYIPPVQSEDDLTEIGAKPDVNRVSIAKFGKGSLKKAIENAVDGIASLKVTGNEDANEVQISIPAGDVNLAAEKGVKRIEVDSGLAKFSINPEILKTSEGSAPSVIELSVKRVGASALAEGVRSVAGNNTVYDFSLKVDEDKIGSFDRGDMVISTNYTLKPGENPNKVVVYYIDDGGNIEVVTNGKYNPETGKVKFKSKHLGMYTAAYADVTFSDTVNVSWAGSSIEALAARGVISGVGDGTFRPNDKVTRAEFIKMLMMAFDLVADNAKTTFNDVKEGEWYYDSVAAAQKLNITAGKPDGSFGVGEQITRQDMAVMAYRAAKLLEVNFGDTGGVQFTDKSDISSYAADAVAAMQKIGVINGIGDGRFAPKNNATRAEAAVIIYRLFETAW